MKDTNWYLSSLILHVILNEYLMHINERQSAVTRNYPGNSWPSIWLKLRRSRLWALIGVKPGLHKDGTTKNQAVCQGTACQKTCPTFDPKYLCCLPMELNQNRTSCKQGMTKFMERVSSALCKRVRFKRHTKKLLTFRICHFRLGVLQCRYSVGNGGGRRVLRPKACEGMQDHPWCHCTVPYFIVCDGRTIVK
jgi:hypothetical protein